MPEPASPSELPLACSLGPQDGAERMRRWQRLADAAAPATRLTEHQLEVRYQPGPGIFDELQSLARAENECCSFVAWAVTDQPGVPTLIVTADRDAPERITPIAMLFGVA